MALNGLSNSDTTFIAPVAIAEREKTAPARNIFSAAPTPVPAILPPAPGVNTGAIAQQESKPVAEDKAALKQAVSAINDFLHSTASSIEFSIDQDSGRTLVKVVDTENNQVLRQYPSKETLSIARELDKLQGVLVRDQA